MRCFLLFTAVLISACSGSSSENPFATTIRQDPTTTAVDATVVNPDSGVASEPQSETVIEPIARPAIDPFLDKKMACWLDGEITAKMIIHSNGLYWTQVEGGTHRIFEGAWSSDDGVIYLQGRSPLTYTIGRGKLTRENAIGEIVCSEYQE